MSVYVITGSATADGRPIYRRADRSWSDKLEEASVSDDVRQRDEWLADARTVEFVVCDPYAIEVDLVEGQPTARSLRESIRASGPTALSVANRPRPQRKAS